ncbi:hypothetical protein Lal_00012236 [Lupinus albus]|nr:hypothetical protein Lal_00012236 [Lupinus albus]
MDERIDRKWMSVNRLTNKYEDGVKSFVKFAYENVEHFDQISYTCWTRHGEKSLDEMHMKENNTNAYEGDRFDVASYCALQSILMCNVKSDAND